MTPHTGGSSPSEVEAEVHEHDSDTERYNPERPHTKRARAPASPPSQAKPVQPRKVSRQPKKTLSLLPTMPFDIVFEILGLLAPRDLLTLAKINKLFRSTLLSPQVTFVWKLSRERAGGPACPSDFTEVQRALLLFGMGCQSCGTPYTRKIDFFIRLRLCASCKRKGVVVKSKFRARFPGEDNSVLELLPSTNDIGDSMYYSVYSRCNYYWIADIESMLRRLRVFQDNITKGLPNATQDLETFKAERKQLVKNIKDDIPRLNAWKNDVASQRVRDIHDKVEKRKKDILDRMMQLGYLKEDLTRVELDIECRRTTELTERMWHRIRPGLEAKASPARETRLIRERTARILQRRNTVKFLYDAYKATLLPSELAYLPRALDICNFPCFKALIESDVSVVVEPKTFAACMDLLPGLLVGRLEALRMALQESMRGVTSASTSTSPSTMLDLATTAFNCQRHRGTPGSRLVIGWSAIASHNCGDEEEGMSSMVDNFSVDTAQQRFVFNAEAAVVAEDLVRCAGLGENALASEMDAKDLRFGCKLCFNTRGSSLHSAFTAGLKWRDAVYHRITTHPTIISTPFVDWVVLPENEVGKIIVRDPEDPKWRFPLYTCTRCSVYLDTKGEEEEVREHVKTVHGIQDPQNLDDYFYFERYRSVLDDNDKRYAVLDPDTYTSFCYYQSRLQRFKTA